MHVVCESNQNFGEFVSVQVNFLPLDIRDEEDIALVLHHADYIVQYGEDLEPKQPKDDVREGGHCSSALLWCFEYWMHVFSQ